MSSDGGKDQIKSLFEKVYNKYQKLPLTRNVIHEQISRIIDISVTFTNELRTCLTKEDRQVHQKEEMRVLVILRFLKL